MSAFPIFISVNDGLNNPLNMQLVHSPTYVVPQGLIWNPDLLISFLKCLCMARAFISKSTKKTRSKDKRFDHYLSLQLEDDASPAFMVYFNHDFSLIEVQLKKNFTSKWEKKYDRQ